MARYSEEDKRVLMDLPVQSVLAALGHDTRHTSAGMFLSPFRDERTPSFHISRNGRQWYDFGEGKGGSVLTLVCCLLNCDGGKAYDFLASISGSVIGCENFDISHEGRRRVNENGITIQDLSSPFQDKRLLDYASRRGISRKTLERWCSEVLFEIGKSAVRNGIAFHNNSGGLVIRTPEMKRCTSSDITTIALDNGGTTESCIVLEGFFDFLSLSEMEGGGIPCDVCVLNSIVNDRLAADWLASHRRVILMLDNDGPGQSTSDKLALLCHDECNSVIIDDWSRLYEGYGDLNEALAAGAKARETLIHQYQSLWNKTFQMTFRKD